MIRYAPNEVEKSFTANVKIAISLMTLLFLPRKRARVPPQVDVNVGVFPPLLDFSFRQDLLSFEPPLEFHPRAPCSRESLLQLRSLRFFQKHAEKRIL